MAAGNSPLHVTHFQHSLEDRDRKGSRQQEWRAANGFSRYSRESQEASYPVTFMLSVCQAGRLGVGQYDDSWGGLEQPCGKSERSMSRGIEKRRAQLLLEQQQKMAHLASLHSWVIFYPGAQKTCT